MEEVGEKEREQTVWRLVMLPQMPPFSQDRVSCFFSPNHNGNNNNNNKDFLFMEF